MYWWLLVHIEKVGTFTPLSLADLDEICEKHDTACIERSTQTEFSVKRFAVSMQEFRQMQAEERKRVAA